MKLSNKELFKSLILIFWACLIILAVVIANVTATEAISPYYKVMKEAAEISKHAMNEIKAEKENRGIPLSEYDKLGTGLIGEYYTSITTTSGVLEAKRTSTDPNWAAVIVGMFHRANLKKGDEIAMVFSGSFPALNISAMAAAQAYGLKTYIMASIGSSNYGANNENFTFFDMAEYLYAKGVFDRRIDLISLGGDDDNGRCFFDDALKENIVSRINDSGITFLRETDFEKNIDFRLNFLQKNLPNVKFVLNVGGSLVGLGTGINAFIKSGFVEPKYSDANEDFFGKRDSQCGILQYFLAKGMPVASLLNIKGLANRYGVAYDPSVPQEIGEGKMYYEKTYNPLVPVIALVLTLLISVFLFIYRRFSNEEKEKYERNYILCGRR